MISLKYWVGILLNIENYMVYEGPPDFPWLWASRKQDMALSVTTIKIEVSAVFTINTSSLALN